MGSSKPWPDAMEVMTGQRKMDASAILEYFKPLHNWLEAKNKELNLHIGWEKSNSKFKLIFFLVFGFKITSLNLFLEYSCDLKPKDDAKPPAKSEENFSFSKLLHILF